jgi:hypothetical protein
MSDVPLSMIARMDAKTLKTVGEEKTFRPAVEAWATNNGWLVHHESQNGRWNKTDTRFIPHSGPGFPDLVLARNGVVHFWELKPMAMDAKHMPTAAQVKWLEECGGRLMRPSDAREIMEILERER